MKNRNFSFGTTPSISFSRSKFNLSHGVKTTFNVGQLVPLEWREVLPGDTFKETTTAVVRVTSSFLKPVMDNLFMEIHNFFVPYRLIYEDTEKVFGNANPSAYSDNNLAEFPSFESGVEQRVGVGTVADYLGIPLTDERVDLGGVSVLPFRAFALIYDQWFRNENIIPEMYVQKGAFSFSELLNENPWSANNYTGLLPYVSKKKDYFTSCLPNPQKGAPVNISIQQDVPVYTKDGKGIQVSSSINGSSNPLIFGDNGSVVTQDFSNLGAVPGDPVRLADVGSYNEHYGTNDLGSNVYAKTSLLAATTVNDLRYAFQLQKMLERDALYGSRYNEYLLGHFGVHSPDSRLQFTEYLGGGRIPITIQQVAQTSAPTEDSPLANVAGYSLSNGKAGYHKGFVEHGIVMTVGFVRQIHTYQQGLKRSWTRLNRNDFYDPLFANLGEQPVYTSELYLNTYDQKVNSTVFGYQEAFADYRYMPSRVSGQMRSTSNSDLDIWHFGDKYSSQPYLTPDFIEEKPDFVDRTLSVPSHSIDNFICDLWFDIEAIRAMPVYSVPGLIDHH